MSDPFPPAPKQGVQRELRQVADSDDWLASFIRVGYLARGAVYSIVGLLAIRAMMGPGEQTASLKDALQKTALQPFGQTLFALVALGLACYAIWHFLLSTREGEEHAPKNLLSRIGYAASGFVNLALAFWVAHLMVGSGAEHVRQEGAAELLWQAYAPLWIVGLAGVVVVGVELYGFLLSRLQRSIPEESRNR